MEEPNKLEQQPNIEVAPKPKIQNKEIITDESVTPLHDVGNGYVEYNNGLYRKDALKEIRPDLFRLQVDGPNSISTSFGTQFPKVATKGDIFVRVDVLPNRIFKFDGKKWIEVKKDQTSSYLSDKGYIDFLIGKIGSGEYDLDLLSDQEKEIIEEYLKNQKT